MKEKSKVEFTEENIQLLFGYDDAESEPIDRLREYYFKNETFVRMTSELPIKILVGFKGIGKSALIKVSIAENKEKGILPILIKPDDIAELGKSDENFLLKVRQWKVGLTRIIGAKVLEELGILDESTNAQLNPLGIKLIPLISKIISKVNNKSALESEQLKAMNNFTVSNKIIVYIDDLDRGWEGKKADVVRISALLNSIRDLANENPGVSFRVALRTDVYYLVRNSDESTDKIDSAVVWYSWTNHEILVMLIKRVLTFFGETVNEVNLLETPQQHLAHHLDSIMERRFHGTGLWTDVPIYRVLMSLIRKRPRDLVKLCALAAREAHSRKSNLIRTEHFQKIFEKYSTDRIQDAINEYRTELSNIEALLFGMKPSSREKKGNDGHDFFVFTTTELREKIGKVMTNNRFVFANGKNASTQDIETFLYKINFITARKLLENGEIQRKYFEENNYLSGSSASFGYHWEIHPAFRWCLQPDNLEDVFRKLRLSSDK